MPLQLPGIASQLPGIALQLPEISRELPGGTTLESLYQIKKKSIWFLIWILKKNRFWPDLTRVVLEEPFTVERNYYSNGQIKYLFIKKNNRLHGTGRSLLPYGDLEWEHCWYD